MLLIKRCMTICHTINTAIKTKKPGDKLQIKGWIKNIRHLKKNIFLDINDGSSSSKFQIVVPKTEQNKSLTTGSSIFASGNVQVAPNGSYELLAEKVEVIADGYITDGYPFTPKQKHPPEYVREYLHLRSRVDFIASQLRLRHRALKAIHDYMDEEDFVQINTPILTTNDCEGAGEVFTVKPDSTQLLQQMARPGISEEQSFFNTKVFLSVSGQMHLEAMTYGLGNTYTLSPAFRAENQKSPHHLSEFYMLEAELAFMEDITELTKFIEKMLKKTTEKILSNDKACEDLKLCQQYAQGNSEELAWLKQSWAILTYDEASKIITEHKQQFKTEVKPSDGLSKEQELFLVAHCGSPVFVIDWPKQQKPFYMKTSRTNPDRVHALDLLMPAVGELCGGSLRESDINYLKQHEHLPKGLDWYIELRKFGGIPTGGFGMGFERYLQVLTGVKNIRDVIPFPRYAHSCVM